MLIEGQVRRLVADFAMQPIIASEIEFYLNDPALDMAGFWAELLQSADAAGIGIFNYGKEDGFGQYEVSLAPAHPIKAASDTLAIKTIISRIANRYKTEADFSAKPDVIKPGSGLHIHIHLENTEQVNVYTKDDFSMSDALRFSIGGLQKWLPDSMIVFAPSVESYKRFMGKSNAPQTISWGANNRTVAIRLPDAPHNNKHIEHRISGADADPVGVIAILLAGIHYGLKNHCEPGQQIYGDASLPIYNLARLPSSYEEAVTLYKKSELIPSYFNASELLSVV